MPLPDAHADPEGSAAEGLGGPLPVPSARDADADAAADTQADPVKVGASDALPLTVGAVEAEPLAHEEGDGDAPEDGVPPGVPLSAALGVAAPEPLTGGVTVGAPLGEAPGVPEGAPAVPLAAAEVVAKPLTDGGTVELPTPLSVPDCDADALLEGPRRDCDTEPVRVASDGEGAPLPDAESEGAPMGERVVEPQGWGDGEWEGEDDPVSPWAEGVAKALSDGNREALAVAVAQKVAGADAEWLPLADPRNDGADDALKEREGGALEEADPLSLTVCVAQAQPVGEEEGDSDEDSDANRDGVEAGDADSASDLAAEVVGCVEGETVPEGESVASPDAVG